MFSRPQPRFSTKTTPSGQRLVKRGVSGWRKLGLETLQIFGEGNIRTAGTLIAGHPLKTRRKLQSKQGAPIWVPGIHLNVLKDFCCAVLFFWLSFAVVCFGMPLGGKRSNLLCFFAGAYFFFEATKSTHQNKSNDLMRVAKTIMYQTPMYFFFSVAPPQLFVTL